MTKINTIKIDDVEYVRADSINTKLAETDGLQYVVIRTYSAGAHTGFLKSREGKEVTLINARRINYFDGACSLSQLAVDGVTLPENCKFSVRVPEIILTEAIEIIPCTEKGHKSIEEVFEWKK